MKKGSTSVCGENRSRVSRGHSFSCPGGDPKGHDHSREDRTLETPLCVVLVSGVRGVLVVCALVHDSVTQCELAHVDACQGHVRSADSLTWVPVTDAASLSRPQWRIGAGGVLLLAVSRPPTISSVGARTREIGTLRVLFTLENDLINVYAVRDRKKAYE